jgi:hypothetical protein
MKDEHKGEKFTSGEKNISALSISWMKVLPQADYAGSPSSYRPNRARLTGR